MHLAATDAWRLGSDLTTQRYLAPHYPATGDSESSLSERGRQDRTADATPDIAFRACSLPQTFLIGERLARFIAEPENDAAREGIMPNGG